MKKMNLKFFGLGAKIVLPLFLLIGLFLISSNTASAQYVPRGEAIGLIKGHLNQLPVTAVSLTNGQQTPSAADVERDLASFRSTFGQVLLHNINAQEMDVAEAIKKTAELSEAKRINEDAINIVKQEYIDLLSN